MKNKVLKISHLADIHIRFSSRHDEYRQVFERLYTDLKTVKPDRISVVGDILHNKINLSPDSVTLFIEFLVNLSSIAPTDVFLGNHDTNLKQKDQGDAISSLVSICKLLNRSDSQAYIVQPDFYKEVDFWQKAVYYFPDSGIYDLSDTLTYGVFSCRDNIKPTLNRKEDGRTYVAFWHGPINGGRMDNGHECRDDHAPKISSFQGYDAILLGDFHEFQTFETWEDKIVPSEEQEIYESKGWSKMDVDGGGIRMRQIRENSAYSGSLCQQSFAESLQKGYLLWNIEKDNVSFERKLILNDYGFSKLTITRGENWEERLAGMQFSNNPRKTKVQIIIQDFEENKSIEKEDQIKQYIRNTHGCEYIRVEWETLTRDGDVASSEDEEYNEDVFENVYEHYVNTVEHDLSEEEVLEQRSFAYQVEKELGLTTPTDRTSRYDLVSVEIRNILSFPDRPVTIDFDAMGGILGVIGENFCGKSNLLRAIVYGLRGEILDQDDTKSIINLYTGSDKGYVKTLYMSDDKLFRITREVIKTKKGNSYPTTFEYYKTEIGPDGEETGEWVDEMSDEKTMENTEVKNLVNKALGDVEDFAIMALHIDGSNQNYLKMKQQDKNDLIGRYMGLLSYRTRHEYVKKKYNELITKQKAVGVASDVEALIAGTTLKKTELESKKNSLEEEEKLLSIKREDNQNKIVELTRNIAPIEQLGFSSKTEIDVQVDVEENLLKKDYEKQSELRTFLNENIKTNLTLRTKSTIEQLDRDIERMGSDIEKTAEDIAVQEVWLLQNSDKEVQSVSVAKEEVGVLQGEIIELQNKIIIYQGEVCPTCGSTVHEKKHDEEVQARALVESKKALVQEKNTFISVQAENERFNLELTNKQSKLDALRSSLESKKLSLKSTEEDKDYLLKNKNIIVMNALVDQRQGELEQVGNATRQREKTLETLREKLQKFDANELNKKANEKIQQDIDLLQEIIDGCKQSLASVSSQIRTLVGELSLIENTISNAKQQLDSIRSYDKLFRKYSFYLQAVHRDGIPAMIIKRKLPMVNAKINSILQDVVDFKCELEIDAKGNVKEFFYFAPDKWDALPFGQASNSQKFIFSIALKNAFYDLSGNHSALPSFMMIDEGFGSLDDAMIMEVQNMLDYLKTRYKNLMVITHRTEIKDSMDHLIEVSKDRSMLTPEMMANNKDAGVSVFNFSRR